MSKWKYKVVKQLDLFSETGKEYDKKVEALEQQLNELGEEGWELVIRTEYGSRLIIFKKPKRMN